MPKPMRYRDIARGLRKAGCTSRPGKGSHEVWFCPCGRHSTVVPRHTTVSPGVVGAIISDLACLPKGTLQ